MLFSQTAIAAGLLALPLASATPVKRGVSFKLPLARRSAGSTDEASLGDIYSDTDWITPVTIGGQKFSLQVDTGSSDTWLLSTLMPSDKQSQFPKNHFYDPTKSTSYNAIHGGTFNISYGATGSIFGNGDLGTDNIQIGSSSVNMPFGLATDCSPVGMVDTTYDGILGLAFGGGNTFKPTAGPTFMEAVQSQLAQPVFTFNIPSAKGSQQMLEFGNVDHSLYTGTLATAAINNGTTSLATGWMGSGSLSVAGKNISSVQQTFLFDTGGLAGTAHKDAVEAYWSQVKGAKDTSSAKDGTGWAAPCSGASAPDLTYDMVAPDGSSASATVPGSFMIGTQTLNSDNTMCSGALQSDGGSGATMGYAFFHSQFTVFNQADATVSFAPYSGESGDASSSSSSSSSASSASSSSASSSGDSESTVTSSSPSSASASASTSTDGPAVKPSPSGSSTKTNPSSNSNAVSPSGTGAAMPSASDSAPGGNEQPKNAAGKTQASAALFALVAAVAFLAF